MPTCPYCMEEIKLGARKCPHCQTSLELPEKDDERTVYILDKGLVRFGKFIAAALGVFIIIGVYVYGLELKDSIRKTSEAEFQVKRGILAIEEQRISLETKVNDINQKVARIVEIEKEVVRHRTDMQQNAARVKDLLDDIRQQKEVATQLVIEMRLLNPSEQATANAKRQERGISAERGKLWKVGANLRFYFMDGNEEQKALVRSAINEWGSYVNLTFTEIQSNEAEIRVSFKKVGSWGYQGTDALAIKKEEPTLNYGDLSKDSDTNRFLLLHEFGHILGLTHEFSNPSAGQVFNMKAVEEFARTAGWSKGYIEANFQPVQSYPGSRPYDPFSIMGYGALPKSFFVDPDKHSRPAVGLSDSDKKYIASLYPR
jgi:serralysin